ncbi:glycogen synthase [Thermosipho melanesiensis]|uniref:Glycogen synthase n=2 Tax=Thermosipho melanesiensis TaxID=46541 RepID=GLGA_THEM4|nr:glycogen/starch synthase [Thermosipho melanesiensis]A6LJ53.1 RecName: Full=Glycogen synthase; AltName: Full=Starch [bacterial glycogen] synthase [Thermosipho melanesiensis BI429]ABR29954.1 glycogen/starch synthase, ADP-glucose type [Thermosipho melanesiensis BI429]APT73160.1 glycogen synthase [Thermosipho melanesiensis]OOC38556.1 glycogen synthase [Thermosipho melanesiensis]OOC40360.1 glycogen synthase [Thermosipho melanesiensis]OOC40624.1 glycogen synthase [Thermosipho melanesiensis]
MKVALISYEVYPFAKVGGLADVVGALPKYLEKASVKPIVIMPKHKVVEKNARNLDKVMEKISIPYLKTDETFDIYKTIVPKTNVPIYFVANEYYFSAENVYEGPDLAEQAIYFSAAVLETLKVLDLQMDVLHVNDWQTSLIPVYLKTLYKEDEFYAKTVTLLTIHNLGYQGIFDSKYMEFSGLPNYLYNIDGIEFYGKINFLKGGILYSDIINTVSPTYANEIQTKEYGEKLDGVLRLRSADLYGVLNGIDYDEYNPETDKRIFVNYSLDNIDKKYENKVRLQKELGLPEDRRIPMIGMITRLVDQKGLDILSEVLRYIVNYDIQFVILGTGDEKYEEMFKKAQQEFPKNVSANVKFDINLAQKIYAASDMFLMPSRYEPCGLGQMYSLRYGTIPIVRYTGGLADTVLEYDENKMTGNGFGFVEYDSSKLLKAVARALDFYKNKKVHWKKLIDNAMKTDLSWERSAKEYVKLYNKAMSKRI